MRKCCTFPKAVRHSPIAFQMFSRQMMLWALYMESIIIIYTSLVLWVQHICCTFKYKHKKTTIKGLFIWPHLPGIKSSVKGFLRYGNKNIAHNLKKMFNSHCWRFCSVKMSNKQTIVGHYFFYCSTLKVS